MPATTPNLAIPYPLGTEPPAGHSNMQSLATRVDQALGADTGWVQQSPAGGFTNQNTTGYRVIGKTCWVSIQMAKNATPLTNTDVTPIFATMPAIARPLALVETFVFAQTGTTTFAVSRLGITTAGVASVYSLSIAANGILRFLGSYPVAGT